MLDLTEARRRKGNVSDSEPTAEPSGTRYPHVKVTNDSLVGWKTKISIDGQDISAWCQKAEVLYSAKGLNIVRIDLLAGSLEVESDAQFELDPASAALLVAQGWTPPAGES